MVAKALDAYGINGEDALARCDIDPQMVRVPDIRVPIEKIGQLLQLAVSETGDTAIGLKVGTFVCPTTFHALTMSMWLSSSLKDAFDRAVRYEQLLSDAGQSGLTEREDEYCYWTELASADKEFIKMIGPAALDTLYSAMVTVCRAVYGESFSPIRVSLIRDTPEEVAPYLDFFRCPVDFSQPLLSMSLDKKMLEKPLPSGNPELLEHSDHVIVKCLSRFDRRDIVGNLRAKLLESLPSGKPSQQDMAFALHLSLRGLQRKLSERGLTYDKVLGEVRRDLAQKYIMQPHLSISEISYLLGFSSSTNFSRNFKSWMGATPREYRHRHAQTATE